VGFVQSLARELAPKNIRVHAICCGYILDRHATWDGPVSPPPRQLDRLGRAEDVAYAALYLASDEAAWVTGQALGVEGGDDVLAPTEARAQTLARG
jgi:3-oxoacyl-[acyl-carrier protein] reductase